MSPLEACWVGSRQIVAVHDLIPLLYPGDYRKQYPFFRYVLPGVLRRAARVVTISNATKQQLMDVYRLPERHISVIHHGVEEPFDRTERFPRAGEYLLWVGSSKKSKNLETLLEGYAVLRRAGWRMPLVLVSPGNGRPLPEGIRLVSSASDEDLARLYRGARLLVMPSLAEGFGLPALEAMASGCPVVASNTAALHEVCGDAVAYVEPSSPESIAEGVARLLSDRNLCGRLSRAGRERSVMFSWDRAAKQHCEIFAEVLESSTRAQLK
jgi:glycosyltransferase involved in cell wall biosynthesis